MFLDHIKNTAENKNLKFLFYGNTVIGKESECFVYAWHINYLGANQFSNMFAADLIQTNGI